MGSSEAGSVSVVGRKAPTLLDGYSSDSSSSQDSFQRLHQWQQLKLDLSKLAAEKEAPEVVTTSSLPSSSIQLNSETLRIAGKARNPFPDTPAPNLGNS